MRSCSLCNGFHGCGSQLPRNLRHILRIVILFQKWLPLSSVFGGIEFQMTVDFVCRIIGQQRRLDTFPVLQSSIARRNPYVDPLSFVQLALLKRLRADGQSRGDLLTAALEAINGIAAGLKNTR
jgi:phosphoenolpyruvate carboxylase